ncbi:MAG: GMC family oxidoreductase N-terminal domain-containing protein [Rhizobiaceae bacterium]|nr:GMC family oxidoreductase N-terminal domain-containing protein [Rhizobiaceae bacterium]
MKADVVIVGAGSAGCVLAGKLTEDPSCRVVLIEAGGSDWNPVFRVPIMTGILFRQRYANWLYETEPESHLDNRRILWPRGKVIGGSTTINGMIWHRGRPSDYDRWAQSGMRSWSWDKVLPRYKSLERFEGGETDDHGAGGAMPVTESKSRNPLHDAFIEAAEQAGHKRIKDYNAHPHEGVSRYWFNIQNGERWSAARAFLKPALNRPNLTVVRNALVGRIAMTDHRATGVVVRTRSGEQTISGGTIILAAGTIGSPQLMMLSGVGPAAHLDSVGIERVQDLPGVGSNLQDHLSTRIQYACKQAITLHNLTRFDKATLAFLQAAIFKSGDATTMPIGSALHFRSSSSQPEPDIQAFFTPSHSQATVRFPFVKASAPGGDQHAFSLSFFVMRPESRGEIRLRDANPASAPLIRPRYLSDDRDRDGVHRAIAKAREVIAQPALDDFRGQELTPGASAQSREAVDRWIASTGGSAFHPTSTCKMGLESDGQAVVDENLNVFGIKGLKIADASVMPTVISGNTSAATMMIASRCAELVRAGQ